MRARFRGAITERITLEYLVYTFYRYAYIFKSQKTNIFPSCVKSSLRIKNNDEGSADPEIQRRKYRGRWRTSRRRRTRPKIRSCLHAPCFAREKKKKKDEDPTVYSRPYLVHVPINRAKKTAPGSGLKSSVVLTLGKIFHINALLCRGTYFVGVPRDAGIFSGRYARLSRNVGHSFATRTLLVLFARNDGQK